MHSIRRTRFDTTMSHSRNSVRAVVMSMNASTISPVEWVAGISGRISFFLTSCSPSDRDAEIIDVNARTDNPISKGMLEPVMVDMADPKANVAIPAPKMRFPPAMHDALQITDIADADAAMILHTSGSDATDGDITTEHREYIVMASPMTALPFRRILAERTAIDVPRMTGTIDVMSVIRIIADSIDCTAMRAMHAGIAFTLPSSFDDGPGPIEPANIIAPDERIRIPDSRKRESSPIEPHRRPTESRMIEVVSHLRPSLTSSGVHDSRGIMEDSSSMRYASRLPKCPSAMIDMVSRFNTSVVVPRPMSPLRMAIQETTSPAVVGTMSDTE